MQGILDAGLLLLHLGLGCGANFDERYATDQLCQSLLQFLAIVVRGGLLHLASKLLDPALDALLRSGAVDDGGVVLIHRDALGAAQVRQLNTFQLEADFFHDGFAARQDRDIFQHGLAAVAEAGGLHGANIDGAAQLVDHERGQGFAFHLFADHQQWLARACDLFEKRQHILHAADFLFVDEDVWIFQNALHALGVSYEVR